MAAFVATACKFYLNGYDLSGSFNAFGLDYTAEAVDDTMFGDTARSRLGGLKAAGFSHQGAADFADDGLDEIANSILGSIDQIMTIAPTDGTDGERAFTGKVMVARITPIAGAVGDLARFEISGEVSSSDFVRGTILGTGAKASSTSGTGRQLGAVGATQKLYAALHVIGVSGSSPTLDLKIQSDDNGSFTSATDRITFNQMTAIGAQFATPVAGAIADDYWRATWTIGGTSTPTFTIVVVVGIV